MKKMRWLAVPLAAGFFLCPVVSAMANESGCRGGSTMVCGASVPLPDMTPVGDIVNVPVPASVLGDSYAANPDLSFRAECVMDQSGGAAYRVIDTDKISCNAFPCQTSNVRLCDTSIPVAGGTPLGGVVHMTMPPPFARDNFTVQCVGNLHHQPVYQITDHAGVTCNHVHVTP